MPVNSLEEAINLTMKKYNYTEVEKIKIYEALENDNFSVITSDRGARDFVKNYYQNLKQKNLNQQGSNQTINNQNLNQQPAKEESPFDNFVTLTHYFDQTLEQSHITKEDKKSFLLLYQKVLEKLHQPVYTPAVEHLLIEAATAYNKEHPNTGKIRKYDFSTMDMTREEACEITNIFGNMEHQAGQVSNGMSANQNYQKMLLSNLISYVYYEHDYHKSLSESVEDAYRK